MRSSRAVRSSLALLLAALMVGVAVVAALPSCSGLPDKTCFGDQVNALTDPADAAAGAACTACLQQSCCDHVGACSESQTCIAQVTAAHACVLDGGPSQEPACKGLLDPDERAESNQLYGCMRRRCGEACSVPSCDLDPAVVLFASPRCDRCIGGACCGAINECYESRGCKLVIECITKHCPRSLGPSMTALGELGDRAIDGVSNDVCEGRSPAAGQAPGACLERCLDEFAPPLGDGGTTDDQRARCLAFRVYTCGAKAGCGDRCERPDPSADGSDDGWEEADDPDAGP